MSGHELIDTYLTGLARRLPAPILDELADGLTETYERHLAALADPHRAAQLALAEFGTCDEVTAAFVTSAPSRRTARTLLASGPVVGTVWATVLITHRAWAWPVSTPLRLAVAVALAAVVTLLATAALDTRHYTRARLTALTACAGLLVLDTAAAGGAALLAPILAWPVVLAVAVSLARIVLTLLALPSLVTA
jgi:hypothetical protein